MPFLKMKITFRPIIACVLLGSFVTFLHAIESSAEDAKKTGLTEAQDVDAAPILGTVDNVADLAKNIEKLVGQNKSLRFGEIVARGPNASQWQGNLASVKAELKNLLTTYKYLKISDLENLKSIEESAAIDGRNVRLSKADYNVNMIARQIESLLVLEVRLVEMSNGADKTLLLRLDPRSVGINPEAEIPPTDAAVKVSDKTMMDIAEKLARNQQLKLLSEAESGENEEDAEFSKSILKNIQANDAQIQRFAKQVVDEVSELMRLDKVVVRQSFDDRSDFLKIEGKLQGVDTSRQRLLLKEVFKVWEKASDTGLKPNPSAIVAACNSVIESEN